MRKTVPDLQTFVTQMIIVFIHKMSSPIQVHSYLTSFGSLGLKEPTSVTGPLRCREVVLQ